MANETEGVIFSESLPNWMRFDGHASMGAIHGYGDPDQYIELPCNAKGWRPLYTPITQVRSGDVPHGAVLEAAIVYMKTWGAISGPNYNWVETFAGSDTSTIWQSDPPYYKGEWGSKPGNSFGGIEGYGLKYAAAAGYKNGLEDRNADGKFIQQPYWAETETGWSENSAGLMKSFPHAGAGSENVGGNFQLFDSQENLMALAQSGQVEAELRKDPIAMALITAATTGDYSTPDGVGFRIVPQNAPTGALALQEGLPGVNGVLSLVYVVRHGTREFTGFTKCKGTHVHGTGSLAIQDGYDSLSAIDLTSRTFIGLYNSDIDSTDPSPGFVPGDTGGAEYRSAAGGYRPELIIFGGDVEGVEAYANVTSEGSIGDITITDPGSGIVEVDRQLSSLTPPTIMLSTPSNFTLFEGFSADVQITDNPSIITNRFAELGLTLTPEAAQEAWCQSLGYADPLAQTFLVSNPLTNGKGIYISSVDIVFQSRPPTNSINKEDVILELRPVTEGDSPARDLILQMDNGAPCSARVKWENVVTVDGTSDLPDISRNSTNFKFDVPVYLEPNQAYAFVVRSNDSRYHVWITDTRENQVVMGELLGNVAEGDQVSSVSGASRKQYAGSLFKSQNGRSWIEAPEQDMMFRVNRCNFNTQQGTVTAHIGNNLTEEVPVDQIMIKTAPGTGVISPVPGDTLVSYAFRHFDGVGTTAIPQLATDRTVLLNKRLTLRPGEDYGDLMVDVNLRRENSSLISPLVDVSDWSCVATKTKINNGELSNGQINFVSTTGKDHWDVGDTIDVEGGGGTGGVITVSSIVGVAPGSILSAYISSPGSRYHKTATVNTSYSGLTLTGEESAHGGNAKFKYITKPVILAPGMDAADIKTFLVAALPGDSRIYVYYKVAAEEDSESFDLKPWTLMRQVSPTDSGAAADQFVEFEFDTGGDDQITYATADLSAVYSNFKTFAIKIVGISSSTTRVPVIRDFRTIAVT